MLNECCFCFDRNVKCTIVIEVMYAGVWCKNCRWLAFLYSERVATCAHGKAHTAILHGMHVVFVVHASASCNSARVKSRVQPLALALCVQSVAVCHLPPSLLCFDVLSSGSEEGGDEEEGDDDEEEVRAEDGEDEGE